jgi:flavorubredoxin
VVYASHLANILRPKLKFGSVIGSYGWSTRVVEQVADLTSNLKLEFLDPVLCEGFPREEDFRALDDLADDIAKKHQGHSFQG